MLGARGIYFGGYPWRDLGVLTADDLNAAIAAAMQEPSSFDPSQIIDSIPDGSLSNSKLMYPYIVIGSTNIPLGPSNITTLTGLSPPVNPSDVATKYYVDNVVGLEGYTAGVGLTLIGNQFNIAQTGVEAGTYGSAIAVPQIVVNAEGQITLAGNVTISMSAQQLSNGTTGTGQVVLAGNPTFTSNVAIGGTLTNTGGRAIITGNANPSLTLVNTASANIYGMWNDGNNIVLGIVNSAGVPQTALGWLNPGGNWTIAGPILNIGSVGINAAGAGFNVGLTGGGNVASVGFFTNNFSVVGSGINVAGGGSFGATVAINGNLNLAGLALLSTGGVSALNFQNPGGGQLGSMGLFCNSVSVIGGSLGVDVSISAGNYVSTWNGVIYGAQGLGALYALRWDGTSLYCWVNTVGFISIGQPSGRDVKREIASVDNYDALKIIEAIPFYSYDVPSETVASQHHDFGWIAEDLEGLIPHSVQRLKSHDESRPDALLPQWQPILARSLRAIQQLTARVKQLEAHANPL